MFLYFCFSVLKAKGYNIIPENGLILRIGILTSRQVLASHPEYKSINEHLDFLKRRVMEAFREFENLRPGNEHGQSQKTIERIATQRKNFIL